MCRDTQRWMGDARATGPFETKARDELGYCWHRSCTAKQKIKSVCLIPISQIVSDFRWFDDIHARLAPTTPVMRSKTPGTEAKNRTWPSFFPIRMRVAKALLSGLFFFQIASATLKRFLCRWGPSRHPILVRLSMNHGPFIHQKAFSLWSGGLLRYRCSESVGFSTQGGWRSGKCL